MKIKNNFLVFLIFPLTGYAQCCSPGNPIGGESNQGVLDENTAKIILLYKGSYSGTEYRGIEPVSSAIENGNYNFLGFGFAWGITNKVTIETESGYFINKTQNYTPPLIPAKLVGRGLTDFSLLIKYNFFKNVSHEWEFSVGGGMKIPLGSYQQTYEGAILPYDLQPTTGAFNYLASFFLHKGFLKKKLRFFLTSRMEFPQKNPVDYQYGKLYVFSFFASYAFSPKWNTILQIRNENRERDMRPSGIVKPSGSQKVFLIPQLSYSIRQKWNLSVLADIPVYQYYNQTQLGSTFAGSLVLSRKFDFKNSANPK